MRFVMFAVLVGVLCPFAAHAYDPDEHRSLSSDALEAVMAQYDASDEMCDAAKAFCTKFGDVTRAVDWFKESELSDTSTIDASIEARGARGPKAFFKRSLATHNNASHFQDQALTAWRKHHANAILLAAQDPAAALRAEAVALHYLQDFFSGGHVVTPRAGMHNAAAGHLHDHFNKEGVTFLFQASGDLDAAIAALTAAGALTCEDTDLYQSAMKQGVTWHGDESLARRQAQKVFVAAISTLSVAEVFAASNGKRTRGLETCFAPREAPPIPPSDSLLRRREGETEAKFQERFEKEWLDTRPDSSKLIGPDGGIRVVDVPPFYVPSIGPCGDEIWTGRYATRDHPQLTKPGYKVSGVDVRSEVALGLESRALRVNVDVLFLYMVDDPPSAVLNSNFDRRYRRSRFNIDHLKMGSIGPTFVYSAKYTAWGLLYDYWYPTGRRAWSWGVRFAPRRYDYTTAQPWRFDYAGQVSVGPEVMNVIFAVERGHGVAPDGRFLHEYFFSVGADIAVASGWKSYPARAWRRITGRAPAVVPEPQPCVKTKVCEQPAAGKQ